MCWPDPGPGEGPARALPDGCRPRQVLVVGGETPLGPAGGQLQGLQLVRLWGEQQQLQKSGEMFVQVRSLTMDNIMIFTKLHLINKRLGLLEPALSPALRHGEEVVPVAGTAAVLEPAE